MDDVPRAARANDVLSSLAARITADPDVLTWVPRSEAALLPDHYPDLTARALLELSDDLFGEGHAPKVVAWFGAVGPRLSIASAARLRVPWSIAAGIWRAEQLVSGHSHGRRSRWGRGADVVVPDPPVPAENIAELWECLALLAALGHGQSTERAGVRREIERRVRTDPGCWAASLPWVLQTGPSLDDLDVTITLSLLHHPSVTGALKDAAAAAGRSGLRARGIEAIAAGSSADSLDLWVLDMAAVQLDRRREEFPRPLGAPAATWLGDPGVEDLVRGCVDQSLVEFAEIVHADGAAEEEGLTQNLLSALTHRFQSIDGSLRLAAPKRVAPTLKVERRTVPKSEEKTIGADIGIVVAVDFGYQGGRLRFGELVQVKKSTRLQANAPAMGADSWRIDKRQLNDLLRHSPSAAYWMISETGNVLVVPAKLLLTLGRTDRRQAAGSFTARYADIRHAAIRLSQYLCDVLIGMWIGDAGKKALQIADGTHSRTRPRHVLEITVGRMPQG